MRNKKLNEKAVETDRVWLVLRWHYHCRRRIPALLHLALKPLHHDEGVNGFFLTNLFRDGVYKYDPANYHGPTLYYIALRLPNYSG